MALLGFGQSLGKREQGGIGCDEVTTTTGHRTIGDSVSAVAAQCDGVGVTLLSQAEERGWVGSVSCITRISQVWRADHSKKTPQGKIQCTAFSLI